MGHRSWLVEVKTEKEVKDIFTYVEKADKLCDYYTCAQIEVFFEYKNKLFVGFSSDGETCGEYFIDNVLTDDREFGLLGIYANPRRLKYLSYFQFFKKLNPKKAATKRKEIIEKLKNRQLKRHNKLKRDWTSLCKTVKT